MIVFLFLFFSCSSYQVAESSFEENRIDPIWKKTKISKNSLEIQNSIVRQGKFAAKLTLKKGMILGRGEDGKITERVELKEEDKFHAEFEETHLYRFSFYMPKDFPIIDTRLVLGQWKQKGKHNPIIAQRFVNGIFYVTVSSIKGKKKILELSKENSLDLMGKWVDVEYKILFSQQTTSLELKIAEYKSKYFGPLGYPEDEDRIYFKFGLYRDTSNIPMVIYFDNYSHLHF